MTHQYLLKKGDRELGPFPLEDIRKLVRNGVLGRSQKVSADAGRTWAPASTFSEIWESSELVPAPQPVMPPEWAPRAPTIIFPGGESAGGEAAPPALPGEISVPAHARGGRGLGLAGFITALSALVLALVPLFIWGSRYEPAYGAVPLAFPLLGVSITGLVMSAIAMGRQAGAFATTGLILGICGSVLGLVVSAGWVVSHDPREDWIRRLTATAEADVQLARKEFTGTLKRYRGDAPGEDRDDVLKKLTKDIVMLGEAHKRLLIAAASTPRFRRHFLRLEDLRTAFTSFSEAIKVRDSITPQQAIEQLGNSAATLKELLDLLELHLTHQLSIEAAQAKFRTS